VVEVGPAVEHDDRLSPPDFAGIQGRASDRDATLVRRGGRGEEGEGPTLSAWAKSYRAP
jgi:hypothetical protein